MEEFIPIHQKQNALLLFQLSVCRLEVAMYVNEKDPGGNLYGARTGYEREGLRNV